MNPPGCGPSRPLMRPGGFRGTAQRHRHGACGSGAARRSAVTLLIACCRAAEAFYHGRMKVPLFNHILLLRYAGLFTYLCTGLPLLSSSWRAEGVETGSPDHVGWCVAYVLFGVMYWFA